MSAVIDITFAVALMVAVGWTTLFSFTDKPGIREFRNLGILASYVLLQIFLFVAGWIAALVTWVAFGVAGGLIYIVWETLQRRGTPAGELKPSVSLWPLFHGLLAWPIMVPEAVEYILAELGILTTQSYLPTVESAEQGDSPDRR